MPALCKPNLLAVSAACALALACHAAAASQPMTFEAGCGAGTRIRIAAVGDLLFHQALQRQALQPKSDYRRFWAPVQGILSQADIVYGNFEGPAADGVAAGGSAARDPGRTLDGRVYGTTPGALVFNYHPSALEDLKASGFTVLSTANNHAADRGSLGIDRTIDNLRRAGLAFTGTLKRDESADPWSTITRAKGLSVAWLACTYSTNGMPDRFGQTLNCYSQRDIVMAELQRLAADPAIDAVILTPHWGQEYAHQPTAADRRYARDAIEAGADAVLGAHPHVLQPWEQHTTAAGREGLIVYSLGNFISNQQKPAQRSGVIALLEVTKEAGAAKARLSAAGFVPTWVEFTPAGHRVTEMKGDPAALGTPLAATLRVLPPANRVTAASLSGLPRSCPPGLVAIATTAADVAEAKETFDIVAAAATPDTFIADAAPPSMLPVTALPPASPLQVAVASSGASLLVPLPAEAMPLPTPGAPRPSPPAPEPPRLALLADSRHAGLRSRRLVPMA